MDRQTILAALDYAIVRRKADAARFERAGQKGHETYAREQVVAWQLAQRQLSADWAAGVVTKVGDAD